MGEGGVPVPKPEPRKRVQARAKRQEAAVVQDVRARCVERDGYCRIGNATLLFGACEGPVEWMHLSEYRRFKTRGKPADVRHTTAITACGCAKHHAMYDAHMFDIEAISVAGADGLLRIWNDSISVLSIPRVT